MTVWHLCLVFVSLCILFALSIKFANICARANCYSENKFIVFLHAVFVEALGLFISVACLLASGFCAISVFADIISMVAK